MLRVLAEIFFQRCNRFGGASVVNQRDAQPEHGIGARGVGVASAAERGCGVAPMLEVAVAYAEVETRGTMLRVDFAECRISLSRGFVVVHLILNVPERGIQTHVPFAVVNRLGEEPRGA